jgi:hypothetical protein
VHAWYARHVATARPAQANNCAGRLRSQLFDKSIYHIQSAGMKPGAQGAIKDLKILNGREALTRFAPSAQVLPWDREGMPDSTALYVATSRESEEVVTRPYHSLNRYRAQEDTDRKKSLVYMRSLKPEHATTALSGTYGTARAPNDPKKYGNAIWVQQV